LPPVADESVTTPITVDELCSFFNHPIVAFVARRLGVVLGDDIAPLDDREPLVLEGLQRWAIQDRLVTLSRAGDDVQDIPKAILGSGRLPLGTVGTIAYEELHADPTAMGRMVRELLGTKAPPPIELDIALKSGARVFGWLRSVSPKGQVLYRFARAQGKHQLDAWIRHLALLASGVRLQTFLIARGPGGAMCQKFVHVAHAHRYLDALIALYRLGQRLPIPLFPDLASDYVDRVRRGATQGAALATVSKRYRDDFEGAVNPYVRQIYGDANPLEASFTLFADAKNPPSFTDIATDVFGPLHAHRKDVP
jgi:exodeoxyribonuclease V gamma subunit